MMQHPAIQALQVSSLLIAGMLLYAAGYGVKILRTWNLHSGSELQLQLERRTYLISSILGYVLVFQILSLFLFIVTTDTLHGQFTGAMCAAGSLNANGYGYPTFLLKITTCILAGVWLIINHVDTRGYDYPLIKVKYGILVAMLTPLMLIEAFLQFKYFQGLHADVITSCCGSLFSVEKQNIGGDLAALPAAPMEWAFYSAVAATFAGGILFCLKGHGGYFFSLASTLTFVISSAALVSFICLYVYELPSHHCPFCILQREYGYVGYVFYASLFCGGVAGLGTGALMPFRHRASLSQIIPAVQRKLSLFAMASYLVFCLVVSYYLMFSPLQLFSQ